MWRCPRLELAVRLFSLRSSARRRPARGFARPDVPQARLQPGGRPFLFADGRGALSSFGGAAQRLRYCTLEYIVDGGGEQTLAGQQGHWGLTFTTVCGCVLSRLFLSRVLLLPALCATFPLYSSRCGATCGRRPGDCGRGPACCGEALLG
jgi:hypothetical protein